MAKKKSKAAKKKDKLRAQATHDRAQQQPQQQDQLSPKQQRKASTSMPFRIRSLWTSQDADGITHQHGWHSLAVFTIAFIVYALTLPTSITYEDAGIFSLMCTYGQAAHPPGYPLFSILCFPFSHLPFVSTVVALNALSGIFAGFACVMMYLITVHILKSECYYGYLAALGLAFSKVFWSQSIIQEVYTLHAFLTLFLFLVTFVYARDRNPRILKWMALGVGLSIANHWPLTVLAGPALVILLLPIWKTFMRQVFQAKMFFTLLGIFFISGPFLYLYILTSNIPSPVTFYEPVSTLEKFMRYISRETYSSVDNQSVSWFDKFNFSKFLLKEALTQFSLIFVPFVLAGFYAQWRRWHRAVCWSLTYLYISTTFLLLALLNFSYSELFEGVFSVYQVAAYPAFAVWAALGLKITVDWVQAKLDAPERTAHIAAASLAGLLVASALWTNWGYNQRSDSHLAKTHARTVLNTLDKDSIFLNYGDVEMPVIQQHIIDGVREDDVTLYHSKGLFLSNRYYHQIIGKDIRARLASMFVKSIKDKPVYYAKDFNFDHGSGVEDFGLYQKVRRDLPAGTTRYTWLPEALPLWESLDIDSDDLKFDITIKRLLRQYLITVMINNDNNSPEVQAELDERLKNGNFYEILGLVEYIITSDEDLFKYTERFGTLQSLVQKLQDRMPEDIHPKDLATVLHADALVKNMISAAQGQLAIDNIIENLRKAVDVYPSSDNPAVAKLMPLYAAKGDEDAFSSLYRAYPTVARGVPIVANYARDLDLH